jgi:hypothetical protein
LFFIGMIQAQGAKRPDAADLRTLSRDIVYASLAE